MAKKGSSAGKTLLFFGIFLIVLVGAGFGLRAAGIIGGAEEGVSVETEKAKLKTITQLVSASGKIQPEVEVIIRPDVSGEIIELAVNEGDFVRKGDLLVRLKPDIFKARIDDLNAALLTQKARLEQARASLIQAEAAHLKNKELYEKDIISELDFIQTKSNYDSQKASLKASQYQIQSAEAQLRKAEEELEQTVIRAPQDGTVTGLAVEFGERVLGNSQMAGTEMMRVSLLDKMEVLVEVNENDIVNISALDTTRIEVDAYPERRFNGIVTEIANSARITGAGSNEQVTNYQVKVRIITPHNLNMTGAVLVQSETSENPEENFSPNFKPGMSATVDIETKTAKNVVSVPIQAVTVRDFAKDKKDRKSKAEDTTNAEERSSEEVDDNLIIKKEDIRKVVFIVEEGIAVRYEVETGISDNTHTQILSGVNAGDEIVIGSYRTLSKNLTNGEKVKVDNNSSTFASVN
ncbi:MAG TPA: efflux RND transporter periplasmic adaptor subunit [Balneola sp.]|jgi:HlyD family secretion protein|nr:efflux transporter periplasmic adaptor subunit [Balneola sp.]MAO76881.1 efflux transporter periplasmic adaptor subunit [Balneola sp.]MBF64448.1 efflux transporter periplasmic adaptor subunit [Balneola sp.]MBF65700.1 efflux transporter periplasmic adaptor subunit [Balneola sp.]HAH49968.1 efflux RND transporter periplasmic adaptor subunit [Balneola sp.]|tara:strand:- start:16025 stop:17416 length:1392 start_codon:yes stop_codon:yes gene_type:complete